MDTTRINHNNSGHKYRIAVDIAKEGSHIWDLTPYFKGRVGDNNFGLQVTWYYQGQLMNVVGMKPYIEGLVGQYSFGKNGEIDMDPDAVPVRYDGSPDDCEEAGKATFYFPSQMFPKEGIFKGFIGVKDDRDGSKNPQISGVTIWFKVLPGIAQMGHACDAYVDELDKALQNFKDKLDNHDKDYRDKLQKVIDDARNTYESETKNAHDSLDALKSQIQANRDEQQNLTERLAGTEQQIQINDVVTRPEFEGLSTKIGNKLAGINFQPSYYQNEADMKAQNPNGTGNVCVTLDTNHKWLFDEASKSWQDVGELTYAGLSADDKKVINLKNTDNLIPDPDFNNLSNWPFNANSTLPDISIDPTKSINNSKVLQIIENGTGSWVNSRNFNIFDQSQISWGFLANLRDTSSDTYALIIFQDSSDKVLNQEKVDIPVNDNDSYTVFQMEGVNIPANATQGYISFVMGGKGTLKILRPQANFGSTLLPYSIGELHDNINKFSKDVLYKGANNELANSDFRFDANQWGIGNWHISSSQLDTFNYMIDSKNTFANSKIVIISNTNGNGWLTSSDLSIKGTKISFGAWINLRNATGANYIKVIGKKSDNSTEDIATIPINNSNDDEFHFYKYENAQIDKNKYISFIVSIAFEANGIMKITRPQLNWGSSLKPYGLFDLENEAVENRNALLYLDKDNVLPNSDFKFGISGGWYVWTNTNDFAYKVGEAKIGNSNIVQLSNDNGAGSLSTYEYVLPVNGNKVVSYGAMVNVQKAQGRVYLGILRSDTGKLIDSIELVNNADDNMHSYKHEGISIPDGVTNISFTISFEKNANIKFARPLLEWSDQLKADTVLTSDSNNLPKFNIETSTDIGDADIKSPFTFIDQNRKITGFVKIAWQGDSSKSYIKKNFKIKLYSDADCKTKLEVKLKSSWNKNFKFNLKANWIDATQARNVVNGRIFAKTIAESKFENATVQNKLSSTQSFGQMDGFPIEVYKNGVYVGLYTLNEKKDAVTYGMSDKNIGEEVITFESPASYMNDTNVKFDGTDYATVVQDEPTDELKNNFTTFVKFLNQSSDSDFKQDLSEYIDVTSVLNTYLFGVLSQEWDTSAKSNVLLTYDNGKYFYLEPYDLDSTWGLFWNGSQVEEEGRFSLDIDNAEFVTEKGDNKLFERIYQLFKPELQSQYQKLRQGPWSNINLINEFREFINSIPEEAYEREQLKWPTIPSINSTSFSQIQNFIILRTAKMDNFMTHLTDPVPTQPVKSDTKPDDTIANNGGADKPTTENQTTNTTQSDNTAK